MTNINQRIKLKLYQTVTISALLILMTACGGPSSGDGTIINTADTPTGTRLTLWCPNVGIGAEKCILDDLENSYANVVLDTTITFALNDEIGDNPKAKFYLWGTAQAKSPQGVYQYQTANALHQLYTAGSESAKNQALKAYCEVFKSYFDSVWFQLDEFGAAGSGVFAPVTVPRRLSELSAQAINGNPDPDKPNPNPLRAFFDEGDAGINTYHARNYMGGKECGGFAYDDTVGDFGRLTKIQ